MPLLLSDVEHSISKIKSDNCDLISLAVLATLAIPFVVFEISLIKRNYSTYCMKGSTLVLSGVGV